MKRLWIIGLLLLVARPAPASGTSDEAVRAMVEAFKNDERGPFQAIMWFYPDGSMRPPADHLSQPGAIQHALLKDRVRALSDERHIFLGQILAGTPNDAFFDSSFGHARMKQYQMEKYLQAVDDGWIFRRARYYRGAFQIEDEEAWGAQFLEWLVARDDAVSTRFLLVRETVGAVPHRAGDNLSERIRAVSKSIAEAVPSFTSIRIKIHGQPEASDLDRVRLFRRQNASSLSPETERQFDTLEEDLEQAYRPPDPRSFLRYASRLSRTSPVGEFLSRQVPPDSPPGDFCRRLADLLWLVRLQVPKAARAGERLALLDLSREAEMVLFRRISEWKPGSLRELLEKNRVLSKAAAGCGYLEVWEWEQVEEQFEVPKELESLSFEAFGLRAERSRRVSEWAAGLVQAVYGTETATFSKFEPLISGFIDDRIRGSILLFVGETAGQLTAYFQERRGSPSWILDFPDVSEVRGLNPGVAMGELVVVSDPAEAARIGPDKIVVMDSPPPDLKPVAGIAVSSEGNLVSHVQLLARNLGIPNAVLPKQMIESLKPFSGKRVFFAVSPQGRVIIKSEETLSVEEKAVVEKKKRSEERIEVPTRKLDLLRSGMIPLSQVRASDSGRWCGPKAANLGELKHLFPGNVGEGLIIPFGAFRRHLEQPVPGSDRSYWSALQEIFTRADRDRRSGAGEAEVEASILQHLAGFREMLREMPFLPGFVNELRGEFSAVLQRSLGDLPVFIRSDTNMEDLKDFTGAGLNLTVFNVVDEKAVLQAIRDVWASPYTERSYRWRQKFLTNPENVYPSILILPTVDVDVSGVMITTGVTTSRTEDVTVAFNRGAGGAVEGQAAETWVLGADSVPQLVAPSRQTTKKRLPATGGVTEEYVTLERPVLGEDMLHRLDVFAGEVRGRLPGMPGIETEGPFDVELGFRNGALRLFQVRPYVENKAARSSLYLRSLDPPLAADRLIRLDGVPGDGRR